MSAHPLSEAKEAEIKRVVRELTLARGFTGWKITDVVTATGVSSRTIYKYFPSKEFLLLSSLLEWADGSLRFLLAEHRVKGGTPETRVMGTVGFLTEVLVSAPKLTKAMMLALTSGQPAVAPMLSEFADTMQLMLGRAIAGGVPDEEQMAVAAVVQQVWFGAMMAWACNIHEAESIDGIVREAMRLLRVDGERA